MSQTSAGRALELISRPALTITESADDYDGVAGSLHQEISPRGFIERMYVADISALVWEILRLRRCKPAMINTAYRSALERLLHCELNLDYKDADAAAQEWFTDEEVKKSVAELLRQFHLDESAIEAEAIKKLAPELETLDRMLMALEVRRDRALRSIAEYRKSFAEQVRDVSDRIIESESILRLGRAGQSPA